MQLPMIRDIKAVCKLSDSIKYLKRSDILLTIFSSGQKVRRDVISLVES
jgi:hypothetical protein